MPNPLARALPGREARAARGVPRDGSSRAACCSETAGRGELELPAHGQLAVRRDVGIVAVLLTRVSMTHWILHGPLIAGARRLLQRAMPGRNARQEVRDAGKPGVRGEIAVGVDERWTDPLCPGVQEAPRTGGGGEGEALRELQLAGVLAACGRDRDESHLDVESERGEEGAAALLGAL